MDDNYFVKVDLHSAVLKATLQGSKIAIGCSQSYYKLLEIRREKTDAFARLRAQVVELLQYSKFLEEQLPYHELIKKKIAAKKKAATKSAGKKVVSKKEAVKKITQNKSTKSSEAMIKLAESLAMIEQKLSALD